MYARVQTLWREDGCMYGTHPTICVLTYTTTHGSHLYKYLLTYIYIHTYLLIYIFLPVSKRICVYILPSRTSKYMHLHEYLLA